MAEALLGLGEVARAWEMASAARAAAEKAGNQLDLAPALAALAAILGLQGDREAAAACARDAAERFDRLGHPARAAEVLRALGRNGL
jgi:hypothetical protein